MSILSKDVNQLYKKILLVKVVYSFIVVNQQVKSFLNEIDPELRIVYILSIYYVYGLSALFH